MTAPGRGTPAWQTRPRGGAGNAFFVGLVRRGGLWLAPFFLFWVALYFLVAAPAARRASFDLARRLGRARWWFAFRHFFTFGMLLLDRVAILGAGQADRFRIEFHGEDLLRAALAEGHGLVLLTAHLGNWEAMGHLLTRLERPFYMVMYPTAAAGEQARMADLARDRSFEILHSDGSPAAAAAILGALRAGGIVGMMGDRVVAGDAVEVPLLGAPVPLPAGAYAVSAAAAAPLAHVFAVRLGWRRYAFHAFRTAPLRYTDRRAKRADLARWAGEFAARIEQFLVRYPYQWGNLFPFWEARAPRSDARGGGE
ncbi:MAG: hypothetical protein KDC87_01810 [Planctomycetes bacterium]|nr:hypothetical protein [Planctomycetota bacterium]